MARSVWTAAGATGTARTVAGHLAFTPPRAGGRSLQWWSMGRCRVDKSIERVEINGFAFPLGVYPIEPMHPRAGYTITFEPADGESADSGLGSDVDLGADGGGDEEESGGVAEGGSARARREGGEGGTGPGGAGDGGSVDWEEWPDRYVFDILVPATRVESLCRHLFSLLPGRIYPILDVLGQDDYREVDPYVSYDLIGIERFLDALRRYRGYFYEDGLIGFGAMCEEPFLYIFVDEHKIVTVRAETALREKIESVMAAFDLAEIEEIAGADSVTHEHRNVLDTPPDRADLLNADEIVEELRDEWRLVLNIDPDSNVDEQGNPLGMTGWHIILRHDWELSEEELAAAKAAQAKGNRPVMGRYAEVYLTASTYREAEDLAMTELRSLLPRAMVDKWEQDEEAPDVPLIVAGDRMTPEHFAEDLKHVGRSLPDMKVARVHFSGWLPPDPTSSGPAPTPESV